MSKSMFDIHDSPTFVQVPEGGETAWLDRMVKRWGPVCVTVTPALARVMLLRNEGNRKMRETHLGTLAESVGTGRFLFTGEALLFSNKGVLLDGQNRLAAVFRTEKSINVLVVFGVDPEAQKVIDSGSPRSAADVIGLVLRLPHANEVAAVSGYVHEWRDRGTVPTNYGLRATREDKIAFAEEHGRSVVLPALSAIPKKDKPLVSRSIQAACYIRFCEQTDPKVVGEFLEALIFGVGLDRDSPILEARSRLTDLLDSRRKREEGDNRTMPFSVIVTAWNAWRRGEKASRTKTPARVPAIEA